MQRVPPITDRSELPAPQRHVADAVAGTYGEIRGPWTVLLRSPGLAARLLPLVHFFHRDSIVEGKLRSVAILAAVREQGASYVWAAQVAAARRNGVSEETIESIRGGSDPDRLPAGEREIAAFARQFAREGRVDPASFDALARRYGAQWLVELVAVIGYFAIVSGVCRAFAVPPPQGDGRARLPRA